MGHKIKNIKMVVMSGMALLTLGVCAYALPVTDKKIESSVNSSHVFQTYLKDDSISVESKAGIVTLTGTVSSPAHKSLAEETVESETGVKSVNNKLTIKGQHFEANSDDWIATKVKTTLLFHRNVNGLTTQVDVKNGVATLQGDAESSAQKDLTSEYAKDIDGVKNVKNLMVVKSTGKTNETMAEKIDDASITAQVKLVLLYHRSTSALKTMVQTVDGDVKLTGKALNAAEKDLVTKLAKDVRGVKNVINHMTIGKNK